MENIFEAIKILSLSSKVGSPSKLQATDGTTVDCNKRKGMATVNCELNGQKYRIELTLKKSNNGSAQDDEQQSVYPSAVFTTSGKLVHLIGGAEA